jgi:hypothetical protein
VSAGDHLAGLDAMSLVDLRAAWTERLGGELPKLRTRELMALALAHRLQIRAHGDLPGSSKRRMAELARRFREDRGYMPTPGPNLRPGTTLMKEWRGVRHEVWVLEEGFSYLGQRFGSLSEVAQHITGTKWNGRVFFGLKERSR